MPAAKRDNKRAAAKATHEDAPKKAQKIDPNLSGVLDAIQQADHLPESCRTMLKAAASGSLMTPSDERHEIQNRAVQWVGDAIAGVQAKLQEAVKSAEEALRETDGKRSSLEAKVTEAAAALEARREVCRAKEAELAEASQAILSDTADVAATLALQQEADASFDALRKEKESLEAALEESAKPLKAGACEPEEAKAHIDRLLPLALSAGLDESLSTALPISGTKALNQRGTFDVMVIDGLESGLQAKAAQLAQLVASAAPAAAERAATTAAMQAKLSTSEERQRAVSVELNTAQASEKDAQAALQAAEAAVASLEPERKSYEVLCEDRKLVLENFEGYSMGCFSLLKEQESASAMAAKKHVAVVPEQIADVATAGA